MSKFQVGTGEIPVSQAQNEQGNNFFVQVPLEVLESGISSSALKLYLILLKYARQSNECWPSQQTLGRDMNLKARRIADFLKELEIASLITIICRAKEGLSNLYRLLKVVPPKGGSVSSSSKPANPDAKKNIPGKQRKTGEGMQDSADESHEVEIHALNTHIHMQPTTAEAELIPTKLEPDKPNQSVCDSRIFVEGAQVKSAEPIKGVDSSSLHIPQHLSTLDKVISVLTRFGVSETRAKQLGSTVVVAKLDDEYVRGLMDWVEGQAASRTIYNPAGLLVQMVHQLAPAPLPKGIKVPTMNTLQGEADQKKEYLDKHLPRLIAIEERNLADALSERDKACIKLRLDKYLALQAKEGEGVYPVGKPDLVAQSAIDGSQAFLWNEAN